MPRVDPEMARVESVFPEALKSVRRQSRVTDGRIDRLVPEIMLDRPRVLAVIGKLVPAGMTQHVAVNKKWEASRLASPRDHALIAGNA